MILGNRRWPSSLRQVSCALSTSVRSMANAAWFAGHPLGPDGHAVDDAVGRGAPLARHETIRLARRWTRAAVESPVAGSIATYNAKRDFRRTAEPPGKVAPRASAHLRYLIQKHDASHLHYDFRLEIGGVLASWAVPKGPSLDPGAKRLAARTEDHPMAYGDFEGVIPEDEYGGGTVMLWDTGTWRPEGNPAEGLRKGELKFTLEGQRLRGSWVLVRLKGRGNEKRENWLLIKHRDAEARPGSGDEVVRRHTSSVTTERELAEIAGAKQPRRRTRAKRKADPAATAATAAARKATPAPGKAPTPARPSAIKGARRAALAAKLKPQLATLVEVAPEAAGYISEIKFDGYRMLARLQGGKAKLFSRNGLSWTGKLPEIAQALGGIGCKAAWLDGEVVAVHPDGRSDFGLLKQALSEKRTGQLVYYLFDILHLDGHDLTACRQDDRKRVLHGLLGDSPPSRILYSEHVDGIPDRIREQACQMHLEGIICKEAAAPYRQDRSRAWLKLKCIQREELVILGFTDPRGHRVGLGALHLGYYDRDGHLHYAGGVGTGFSDAMLPDLRARLDAITRRIGPRVLVHGEGPPRDIHWVKPRYVAELQFLDWTPDKVVRHASFLGLRDDKEAVDVIRDPPGEPEGRRATAVPATIVHASPPKARRRGAVSKAGAPRRAIPAVIDTRHKPDEVAAITHPDKRLWPDDGVTKQDLAAYWSAMAEVALPHIAGRPLALVRCPDGIDDKTFFQKKRSPGFPAAIHGAKAGGDDILTIGDAAGLRALAQMAAIEIHPWGATTDAVETPNRLIFDLDPDEGLDFGRVIAAAHIVRDHLKALGLQSFCKTTGGKGLHVVVPIRPAQRWPEAKAFTAALANALAGKYPRDFTAALPKAARKGKIFVDYLRNGRGATAIAAFSPRARPGASVAMPLRWSEVKPGLDPRTFQLRGLLDGPGTRAGAWKGFFEIDQGLGARARRRAA